MYHRDTARSQVELEMGLRKNIGSQTISIQKERQD